VVIAVVRLTPGLRRGGERGGDAGDDLAFDSGRGERRQLLFQTPEDARVAALQAHDARAALRVAHQQHVDLRLPDGVVEPALADVDPARLRCEAAQRGIGQRVEQHDVGFAQPLHAAQRDQVRRAGAGADERDVAWARHAAASTSSAPLVRCDAGSTTISAPAVRLAAYGASGSGC
jgi:hypothetical protein